MLNLSLLDLVSHSISFLDNAEKLPRDCYDVQQNIQNISGIYRIRLDYSAKPIFVFCDMETDEGGWTVSKP